MSVNFNRNTAFQIISNQKMGFSFGVPERPDANSLACVLPILRSTSIKRAYITLPETDKVDISDTGSINKMRFTNKSDDLVFVRSGTMLKGSTQERAVIRSAFLFPGSTQELEVRCIHQTRGIQRDAKVKYGGITPLSFDQSIYRASYTASNQSDFWHSARAYSMSVSGSPQMTYNTSSVDNRRRPGRSRGMSSRGGSAASRSFVEDSALPTMDSLIATGNFYSEPSDDLAASLNEFASSFSELLAKVKMVKNQVGLGLVSDVGVETIELFDQPLSWKAMHEDAVKRVGSDVVKNAPSGVFEFKQDRAISAVQQVLATAFEQRVIYEHRSSNGEPSVAVVGLSNSHYTGEIVELDGRVAHAVILRMVNAV